MAKRDVTERFTGKADVYARYRPGYPERLLGYLSNACGLLPAHVVADIGSGTGKLSEAFLANGNVVYGVEPNSDMRRLGELHLAGNGRFHSIAGTAEATGLATVSVDMVSAGQAFHWFDPERSREEFRRILKPSGCVVLVWNVRNSTASKFLGEYEAFLKEFSVDYSELYHGRVTEGDGLSGFFTHDYATAHFPNPRRLDFDALRGGYLSTSYAVAPEDAERFALAMKRLRALFDEYQENGTVGMPLETNIYHGRV